MNNYYSPNMVDTVKIVDMIELVILNKEAQKRFDNLREIENKLIVKEAKRMLKGMKAIYDPRR